LFGLSLHLGIASNNYAEYAGVILAKLYGVLFGLKEIEINSDSNLVVQ
jgi:ribonuclease HI